MRTSTAYFAGVGTVAVAIAAGLGGGLLFANIVAPHEPKYAAEPTKLDQRMAVRSIDGIAIAKIASGSSESRSRQLHYANDHAPQSGCASPSPAFVPYSGGES